MEDRLRIVVADDEPEMWEFYSRILPRLGHRVVGVGSNGADLVKLALKHRPELIITDVKMPKLDGIQAAGEIYRHVPIPIILVSAYHDLELIERAEADHVLAYLVKPIKAIDLSPAIALARTRFFQFEAMRKEANNLRQTLDHRQIIERAKTRLMREEQVADVQAFNRMQQLASQRKQRLVEIAEAILADNGDEPLI